MILTVFVHIIRVFLKFSLKFRCICEAFESLGVFLT